MGAPLLEIENLRTYFYSPGKQAFVRALQRLVPNVRAGDVVPAGSGVRAQAVDRSGQLIGDFRIAEGKRWLHLLNAPSPAATACLSIGSYIAGRARVLLER